MFPTINDPASNDNSVQQVVKKISNDQANPARSYEKTISRIIKNHNAHEDNKLLSWENDNSLESFVRPKMDAAGAANKTLDRIIANHGREEDPLVSWENDNERDFYKTINRNPTDEDHNETLNRIMAKQSRQNDAEYVLGPDKGSEAHVDLGRRGENEYLKSIDNTTTNILDVLHGMFKMLEDISDGNSVVPQMAREMDHEAGNKSSHMDPDTLSDALKKALKGDQDKEKEDSLKTQLIKITKAFGAGADAIALGGLVGGLGALLPHNKKADPGGYTGHDQDPARKSSNPRRSTGVTPKETEAPEVIKSPVYSTGKGYQKASFIPKNVAGDKAFQSEVTRIARKYNMSENDLYTVMSFETGGAFNPGTKNKGSSATGLIQFMTKGKTWATEHGYTRESLSKMSRSQQMKVVDQYFHDNHLDRIKNPTLTDAYMTVYKPAAVGKGDSYVHARRGSKEYYQNRGFDKGPFGNNDGIITSGEIANRVRAEGQRLNQESVKDSAKGNTIVVVNNNQKTVTQNSHSKAPPSKPAIPPARSHFWDGWAKYFSL